MHHSDEHTLEMYVLEPDRFAPEQLAELRSHLQQCSGCRAVEEGLRQFHEELRRAPGSSPDAVPRMMEAILPTPRVIRLHPYHAKPHAGALNSSYTTVLAAMTVKSHAPQLNETVATLASEPEQTLVRIRREGREHSYRMYVLADDPRKRDCVVVSLPAVGEFVTDQNGQVSFEIGASDEPVDWGQVEGFLKLPVAVFSFHAADLPLAHAIRHNAGKGTEEYVVELDVDDGRLCIRVRGGEGSNIPTTALLKMASGISVATLVHGTGEIALKGEEGSLMLRLYQ